MSAQRSIREELEKSLANPHPETLELAESGLADWVARIPKEEVSDLLDPKAGTKVCWQPATGWQKAEE